MLYKISASYLLIAVCNITYISWHQLTESAVPPLYPTRWRWCRSPRQALTFKSVSVRKFLLVFSHPDAAMIHWTLGKHYYTTINSVITLPQWWNNYVRNKHFMLVEASWNVMAHVQKPDFISANRQLHLNWRGRHFSWLLAAEVCASAFTVGSNATHSILPVSPSPPLPCVTVCHHISTGVYH